jgi:hypothetical protein
MQSLYRPPAGDPEGALRIAMEGMETETDNLTLREYAGHFHMMAAQRLSAQNGNDVRHPEAVRHFESALNHYRAVFRDRGEEAEPDMLRNMLVVLIQLGAILAILSVYFARLWDMLIKLPSDRATQIFVLGILIGYLIVRTRIPGRNLLDSLSMLPLAVPGLVLAFGYLSISVWFRQQYPAATEPDGWLFWLNVQEWPVLLLIIAYAARRLPYVVRSLVAE